MRIYFMFPQKYSAQERIGGLVQECSNSSYYSLALSHRDSPNIMEVLYTRRLA